MSGFRDDELRDAVIGDADIAAVFADDALLDVFADDAFGSEVPDDEAVTWDFAMPAADPAMQLLGALRGDVSDQSDSRRDTMPLPAVDLALRRRRRAGRLGRRTLVSGAVAFAVLSASGVAAAGITSNPGAPLYPIHKLILGNEQTASEKAAVKVERFLANAERALDRGRLTDAHEQLLHAGTWLARVDAADQGDLAARLAALQSRYDEALAAVGDTGTTGRDGGDGANNGHGNGVDNSGPGSSDDDHGKSSGQDNSKSGDDHGKGNVGRSEPGDDHDNSGQGSGAGSGTSGESDDHSSSGSGSDDGGGGTIGSSRSHGDGDLSRSSRGNND